MLLLVLPDPLTCHWVAPGMMSLGIRQLHTDEAFPVDEEKMQELLEPFAAFGASFITLSDAF